MSARTDTRPRAYLGARVLVDGNPTLSGIIVGTAVHEVAAGSSELCRSCWIVRLDTGDWIQGKASFVRCLLVHDDNVEIEPCSVAVHPEAACSCRNCMGARWTP